RVLRLRLHAWALLVLVSLRDRDRHVEDARIHVIPVPESRPLPPYASIAEQVSTYASFRAIKEPKTRRAILTTWAERLERSVCEEIQTVLAQSLDGHARVEWILPPWPGLEVPP